VDVGAAIDAVIVQDDDADRELVAADRLDLHAAEAEGAITLDREHLVAGLDGGRDGGTHADAHYAPGADIEALARLVHVDDTAGEIERIGALVDQDRVRPLLDDRAQHAQRTVIVHRYVVVHEARRHFGDVLFALRLDGTGPLGGCRRPVAAHPLE